MKRILGIVLSVVMLLAGPGINSKAAEIEKGSAESFEESVDTFFSDKMQEYDIPGAAVVVVEHGKVVLEKSYGVAEQKENVEFTNDTTFRIASITKTFSVTGLMQLVQERSYRYYGAWNAYSVLQLRGCVGGLYYRSCYRGKLCRCF